MEKTGNLLNILRKQKNNNNTNEVANKVIMVIFQVVIILIFLNLCLEETHQNKEVVA